MKTKMMLTMRLTILIAGLILFTGCEGPEGPQGPEGQLLIEVYGVVETPSEWDPTPDAWIYIQNSPSIPSVKVNNQQIPYRGWYDYGMEFYNSNIDISIGDNANLGVNYSRLDGNSGIAQATTILPDTFHIISHNPDETVYISLGDSLEIKWNSSAGALAYEVDIWLDYEYYTLEDTTNDSTIFMVPKYYSIEFYNKLVTDTSIIFTEEELFPENLNIDYIVYSWGGFDVDAISLNLTEGAMGNVTGDGYGFFFVWANGDYLNIEIAGTKSIVKKENKRSDSKKKFLEYIMNEYNITEKGLVKKNQF